MHFPLGLIVILGSILHFTVLHVSIYIAYLKADLRILDSQRFCRASHKTWMPLFIYLFIYLIESGCPSGYKNQYPTQVVHQGSHGPKLCSGLIVLGH
jgi:hypothetical protein